MATLSSQSIASSYEQLLHVDRDGGGNGTTLVNVKDGDNGTTFDVQLSSNSTNFQTDFQIGGTAVTSTAAELNLLDGSSDANSTVSKAVILDSSGNIALPDGKGIDFSANTDDESGAGSISSELLDDYEEGTWSPVLSDGTNAMTMHGSYDTGYYTKIGNLVHVSGIFITTSLGSASGDIRITGLPFTVANNAAAYSGAGAAYGGGLAITAGHSVSYHANPNTTIMELRVWDATTGITGMQASEWTADGEIIVGFSYRAA